MIKSTLPFLSEDYVSIDDASIARIGHAQGQHHRIPEMGTCILAFSKALAALFNSLCIEESLLQSFTLAYLL